MDKTTASRPTSRGFIGFCGKILQKRNIGIITGIFLLNSLSFSQTPGQSDKVFSLNTPGSPMFKDCGLITRTTGNLTENLSPSCLQSVDNLYYDSDYSLDRRGGYTQYNLTACSNLGKPIKGLWPFNGTDGVNYLIAFSSNSMYQSSGIGDCTLINYDGKADWNLSQSSEMECVQLNGFLWCTDGVDQPFYLNQVSSATNSTAPIALHIGTFRNRILESGVSGSLTDIYLSGELNGTDWSIPPVQMSTSAAILSINGTNDGLKVNCLMGEFQNQYYIGRNYDLWALSGYSLTDFTLRKVSGEIGCIQPKSVQEVNNQLLWISKRGIESLGGTQITPVSYYIRPTISQIISATGNSRSQLVNGNNFASGNFCAAGNGACTSSTIFPGFVIPSSWSVTENTIGQFNLGTLVNVSTTVTNFISFTRPGDTIFINAGAELDQIPSGSPATNVTNWTIVTGAGSAGWLPKNSAFLTASCANNPFPTPKFGSFAWYDAGSPPAVPYKVPITITDTSGNVLVSTSATITNHMVWTKINIPLPVGYTQIKVNIKQNNVGDTMTSTAFVNGYNFPIWFNGCDNGGGSVFPVFDVDETISQPTTGSYQSQCYDTAISTPVWGLFNASVSSNSQSGATFQTQVSNVSCSSGFDPAVAATLGSQITSANKEFIQYISSFTLSSSTNVPAEITNINLSAETTGYYITPAIQVSTPTSWGAFQVDAFKNSGSFTFWLSTGATAAIATSVNANWAMQSPNTQISVTTSTAFIAARVLFTLNVATQVPTLTDMTFNWNAGSNAPPVSSMQYNDRYYLFYTTNTTGSPVNDHAVVYDYNGKWTLLDDIHAYSATLYLNQPFIGDSNSTGFIYQLESGNSDNGNPFNYSWTTGDMSMGTPSQRKDFERLYIFLNAAINSSQNTALTCIYSLDGDNGNYPLQSYTLNTTANGYSVAKFQFPVTYPTTGHWINISCSNSGTNGPLKTMGLQLIYKPESYE